MRIMAIDYGDAHTGVAISDPTGMLAGWTTTIDSRKQDVVVEQLRAIIAEWQVTELVLGYPKNMNDTKGERVLKSEALAQRLTEETGLPVVGNVCVRCGQCAYVCPTESRKLTALAEEARFAIPHDMIDDYYVKSLERAKRGMIVDFDPAKA